MAEVSIIVPVYQVERYLPQCVESILAQTFPDFELILVDDGSKDGSGQICDEYAGRDSRVQVVHQQNGGLSAARNRGLELAGGAYFMFVDSDDFIEPTMVECLYESLLREDADVAACNFLYFYEDDRARDFSTALPYEVLSGWEIFYERKNDRSYGFWTIACNKLYKKSAFPRLRFRVGRFHEDEFWANDLYQRDIRVVAIPQCLYHYRQRSSSITATPNLQRNFDILDALYERMEVYLLDARHAPQTYKVLIYALEYLAKSRKMLSTSDERRRFLQKKQQARDIAARMKAQKLSAVQHLSLFFIAAAPCLMFAAGIKFRGLLERFL